MEMSDDERDVDIESEDDDMGDDDLNEKSLSSTSSKPMTQAEKRAHHNALERKRRDHIKDSFTSLRDSVPSLHGEKSSRAQILKKAAEYIQFMRRKNSAHQHDIEDLKRQNHVLENQIRALERARLSSGIRTASATVTAGNNLDVKSLRTRHSESDNSDSETHLNFSSVGSTNSTSTINVSGGTKKLKVLTVGTPAK